jgi:hypothetical protein
MGHTTRARLWQFTSITFWLSGATLAAAQDPAPPVEAPPPSEGNAPVEIAPLADADKASPFALEAAVGVGIRAELVLDPDRDEPEDSPVYTLNHNLRPYISGQVHEYIKFEGNLDSNAGDIVVLDAVLKLEFHDYFNLWAGRFLPPSDRANLSGPYFQNAWTYPGGVHGYPSVYAGRNDGLAIWGQINGGQFKWQVGAFDMGGGTPDPRLAARVTYNVLDPEPGYYNSSTYYGSKDVLAFGAALQHKAAPEGAPDEAADTLWNLDALYENSFAGAGTLDVEAAFYGFGGADAGTSFFVLGSFMFEDEVGFGRLQPMLRVQRAGWGDGDAFPVFGTSLVAPADVDASLLTLDAGLHYIISGHNARLAATVQHTSFSVDVDGTDAVTDTVFILGGQVQAF